MSGLSPAQRLRTKTSDLSDFFRGTSHHSRHSPNDVRQAPGASLDVPSAQEPSGSSKKRGSRIPFLGRTRKKSTHSSETAPLPSSSSHVEHETAVASQTSSRSFGDGHTVLMISSSGSSSSQDLLPSTLPPLSVSPQSLGSKFAAHFTPSKSRTPSSSPRKSSQTSSRQGGPSDSLSPPASSPRSFSFDSTSSGTSQNRAPTPRPTQPTITVSLSPPENFDEFGDLFTLPRKSLPAPPQAHLPIPRFEHIDSNDDDTDNITLSPTPPGTPRMHFPNPPPFDPEPSQYSKALPDADTVPRHHSSRVYLDETPVRPGSRSSVKSSRNQQRPASAAGHRVDLARPEESDDNNEVTYNPGKAALPGVIDISPWTPSQKRRTGTTRLVRPSTAPRSCMKSSIGPTSGPPTIPLPSPPSTAPPMSSLPTIPSLQSLSSGTSVTSYPTVLPRRPRAHTISSVPSAPRVGSPFPSSASLGSSPKRVKSITQDKATDSEKSDWGGSEWEKSDIENVDKANPEQLKQALKMQNLRFEELVGYLLKITEKHVAEKTALEKKIEALEREATRKDQEIKGLTWLVVNGRGPGGASGNVPLLVGANSRSTPSLELEKSTTRKRTGSTLLRGEHRTTDDSEAESSSSARDTIQRKHRTMIVNASPRMDSPRSSYAKLSAKGLGFDFTLPDMPYSNINKRSSASSFSTSPASSTSSLLPPSPTATSTVSSSLSAIPEVHPSLPSRSSRDSTVAAAILAAEKEERRASRALRRTSTSSLTPAAAYAANLKRGRPPSIAQVLDQSPTMEDVLEKLRPFGGPTPST